MEEQAAVGPVPPEEALQEAHVRPVVRRLHPEARAAVSELDPSHIRVTPRPAKAEKTMSAPSRHVLDAISSE